MFFLNLISWNCRKSFFSQQVSTPINTEISACCTICRNWEISPRFKLTWRIRAWQQRRKWNSWRLAAEIEIFRWWKGSPPEWPPLSFQQKKNGVKKVDSEKQKQTKLAQNFSMKLHFSWIFYSVNYKYKVPSKTSWYLYETPLKINGCKAKIKQLNTKN